MHNGLFPLHNDARIRRVDGKHISDTSATCFRYIGFWQSTPSHRTERCFTSKIIHGQACNNIDYKSLMFVPPAALLFMLSLLYYVKESLDKVSITSKQKPSPQSSILIMLSKLEFEAPYRHGYAMQRYLVGDHYQVIGCTWVTSDQG